MSFRIKHTASGTYYKGVTAVGPLFGATRAQARVFDTRNDAANAMYLSRFAWAFTTCDIEEALPVENEDRCKHCGLTEAEHGHQFEAADRPAGCRCNPVDWGGVIAPVCERHKPESSSDNCVTCDHLLECHESTASNA